MTAFDAYVKPVLRTYLEGMERDLAKLGVTAPLQIMQSRGGLSRADSACERPVRLFLSGPAAGVIGGQSVGSAVQIPDIITMDVGGTSCDIALIANDQPLIRPDGLIDGYTVRVPMVDVNAIGSGGGSIAWIDSAGGFPRWPPIRRVGTWTSLLRPWRKQTDGDRRICFAWLYRSRIFCRWNPEARS